jgi:hypothetical protein
MLPDVDRSSADIEGADGLPFVTDGLQIDASVEARPAADVAGELEAVTKCAR